MKSKNARRAKLGRLTVFGVGCLGLFMGCATRSPLPLNERVQSLSSIVLAQCLLHDLNDNNEFQEDLAAGEEHILKVEKIDQVPHVEIGTKLFTQGREGVEIKMEFVESGRRLQKAFVVKDQQPQYLIVLDGSAATLFNEKDKSAIASFRDCQFAE